MCTVLSLLLKPAAQAQVEKTKLFINCFRNPTSTCAAENWKNELREATYCLSWIDCSLKPIKRFGVKHSVGKVIPNTSLGRQETPCKLRSSTHWYFKLKWMWCSRSSSMSNSHTKQMKADVSKADGSSPCTTYTVQQHDVDDPTARKSYHYYFANRLQILATEYIWRSKGLGEQMHSSNEVTQRRPQRHS